LERYRVLIPQQLDRCGFPVEKLEKRLGRGLIKGLVADG
jgi:hypothetical protein